MAKQCKKCKKIGKIDLEAAGWWHDGICMDCADKIAERDAKHIDTHSSFEY